MYQVATQVVTRSWGNPADMTNGLGVLLLTWNQAFYRYGEFEFNYLEKTIAKWLTSLRSFRKRKIESLSEADFPVIKRVFGDFLESLRVQGKNGEKRRSPVAAAKALHLLAPSFFPLWDDDISWAYGCYWYHGNSEASPEKYIEFMKKIKANVEQLENNYARKHQCNKAHAEREILERHPRPNSYLTLVKLIDEYNYSKHHEGWIT